MLDLCEDLQNQTKFVQPGSVKCWIYDFKKFV